MNCSLRAIRLAIRSGLAAQHRPARSAAVSRGLRLQKSSRWPMASLASAQHAMVELFQKHVGAELAGDLDTTMATMPDDPHLDHVASMAGGVGRDGVRAFYRDHLVGKFFPPDVKMTNVSRTVGDDQVVAELVISFTHTTPSMALPASRRPGTRSSWPSSYRRPRTGRSRTNTSTGIGRRAGADRAARSHRSSGDRRRECPQGA